MSLERYSSKIKEIRVRTGHKLQCIPQPALCWELQNTREDQVSRCRPGRPMSVWRSMIKKNLLTMGLAVVETAAVAAAVKNGIEMWPNASAWMQAESRFSIYVAETTACY